MPRFASPERRRAEEAPGGREGGVDPSREPADRAEISPAKVTEIRKIVPRHGRIYGTDVRL
jgi:hypothetical protein